MADPTKLTKETLMAGLFGSGIGEDQEAEQNVRGNSNAPVELRLSQIRKSPRNHFSLEDNEDMAELVASVRDKGVIQPIIVRPWPEDDFNGYEILSGHRRTFAARSSDLNTIPAIIVDADDDDAEIIIADSNLHRPEIKISEKAFSIRKKYDAIKRKVGRNWEENSNCDPGSQLKNSAEIIAETMGMSDRTIQRNIRLTHLIPELLCYVDAEILPIKAGVQLSYLSPQNQEWVRAYMDCEGIKISESLARELRELPDEVPIDAVGAVLKKQQDAPKPKIIKLPKQIAKQYFPPEYEPEQIHEVLEELLTEWAKDNNPDFSR